MSDRQRLLLGGLMLAAALLVTLAALLLLKEAARRDLVARVAAAGGVEAVQVHSQAWGWLLRPLQGVGQLIHARTRLYTEQDLAALAAAIGATGLNPRQILPLVLGTKVVFMLAVPLLAVGYGMATGVPALQDLLFGAAALPVALLVPEWGLRWLRRPYAEALRRGAPDALDLLVICTEAGMGLEAALEQVARQMRRSNRAIAGALSGLVDELKLLPDRRQAFQNFGNRSGVEALRRMAAIIGQALEYGTPLGQALRAVAGELRRERMTRLEAKAVKLPALLIFPLVAFILPALFIALMGSPMLRLLDTLGGIGHH